MVLDGAVAIQNRPLALPFRPHILAAAYDHSATVPARVVVQKCHQCQTEIGITPGAKAVAGMWDRNTGDTGRSQQVLRHVGFPFQPFPQGIDVLLTFDMNGIYGQRPGMTVGISAKIADVRGVDPQDRRTYNVAGESVLTDDEHVLSVRGAQQRVRALLQHVCSVDDGKVASDDFVQ
jgi:hypothetical protein